MNLIDKFILLTNQLKSSLSEVEWKEDTDKVQVVYQGILGHFCSVLANPALKDDLCAEDTFFLIESKIRGNLLFVTDVLEHRSYGHINDNDLITIELIFHKKLRLAIPTNAVLFFRETSFYDYFRFNTIAWNMFFQNVDDSCYVNLYLPVSNEHSNEYLKISPLQNYSPSNHNVPTQTYKEICRLKEIHKQNTRTSETYWPVPVLFYNINLPVGAMKSYLNSCFYVSVLVYIANRYEGENFSFRGEKNISVRWDSAFQANDVLLIKKIFDFAYNDSHTEDRFEILQNVIVLYSNNIQFLNEFDAQLKNIIETVQRHFTLYVNNEVNVFLGQTKALLEESQKHASQAKEEADKIVSNINQTILGIITALITGLLAIINQNTKLLVVSIIIHILYFVISFYVNSQHSKTKKESIQRAYEFYASKYSNLSRAEKEELDSEYVKPGLDLINKYTNKYKWITVSISTLLFLLIIVGGIWPGKVNVLLDNTENNKTRIDYVLSLEEGTGGNSNWWKTQNKGVSRADKKLFETVTKLIEKDTSLENIISPKMDIIFNSSTFVNSIFLITTVTDKNKETFYSVHMNYKMKDRNYRSLLTIHISEEGDLIGIKIDNTLELSP